MSDTFIDQDTGFPNVAVEKFKAWLVKVHGHYFTYLDMFDRWQDDGSVVFLDWRSDWPDSTPSAFALDDVITEDDVKSVTGDSPVIRCTGFVWYLDMIGLLRDYLSSDGATLDGGIVNAVQLFAESFDFDDPGIGLYVVGFCRWFYNGWFQIKIAQCALNVFCLDNRGRPTIS